MSTIKRLKLCASATLCSSLLLFFPASLAAAPSAANDVMGELKLEAVNKAAKASGVWIDGQYVGYVEELKGSKKLMLLPGEHEINVRQSGYADFNSQLAIEPGQTLVLHVEMLRDPRAIYPSVTSEIRMDVDPNRAAVFVDGRFVGHVHEFQGGRGMLIAPGEHHIRIALPGYQTFETDVNLVAGQKFELKTDLLRGSVAAETTALIKR